MTIVWYNIHENKLCMSQRSEIPESGTDRMLRDGDFFPFRFFLSRARSSLSLSLSHTHTHTHTHRHSLSHRLSLFFDCPNLRPVPSVIPMYSNQSQISDFGPYGVPPSTEPDRTGGWMLLCVVRVFYDWSSSRLARLATSIALFFSFVAAGIDSFCVMCLYCPVSC